MVFLEVLGTVVAGPTATSPVAYHGKEEQIVMFDDEFSPPERYEVLVRFLIEADTPEDAEQDIKEIIEEGILATSEEEERNPKCEYDIESSEPAEVEI